MGKEAATAKADPGSEVERAKVAGERVHAFVADIAGQLGIAGDGTVQDDVSAEATSLAIMDRLLGAESAEDVLGGNTVMHSEDVLGVPLKVRTVRWQRSDFEVGPSFYAVVEADAVREGGPGGATGELEHITFTCGSRNVMAQLYRLGQLGTLDKHPVRIVEAPRQTRAGYKPQWLELAR